MNKRTALILFVLLFVVLSVNVKSLPAVTTGLQGHWDFNEGSGTIAEDSQGTNDATITNGDINWVTGVQETAWEFQGGLGEMGTDTNRFSITDEYTFIFWGFTDISGVENRAIIFDNEARSSGSVIDNNVGWWAEFISESLANTGPDETIRFVYRIATKDANNYGTDPFIGAGFFNTQLSPDTGWNMFVGTRNPSSATAYQYKCNGELVTDSVSGSFGATMHFGGSGDRQSRIGGGGFSSDDTSIISVVPNGYRIDKVSIYNTELSSNQIDDIFNQDFRSGLCIEPETELTGTIPPGHNAPGNDFFGVPLQPVADGFNEPVRVISWLSGIFLIILLMATMGVAWGIVGIVIGALVGLIASFALGLFPIWFLVLLIFGIIILGLLIFRNFGGGEE